MRNTDRSDYRDEVAEKKLVGIKEKGRYLRGLNGVE
jgi:hypothetical protein